MVVHARVVVVAVAVAEIIIITVPSRGGPIVDLTPIESSVSPTIIANSVIVGTIVIVAIIRGRAWRRGPNLVRDQADAHQVAQPQELRAAVIHHTRDAGPRDEDNMIFRDEGGVPAPSGHKKL